MNINDKDPNGGDARQLAFPLVDRGQTFEHASSDFRFAAAVASFGMVLRDSQYKGTASVDSTLAIAEHSIGSDRNGQRHASYNSSSAPASSTQSGNGESSHSWWDFSFQLGIDEQVAEKVLNAPSLL